MSPQQYRRSPVVTPQAWLPPEVTWRNTSDTVDEATDEPLGEACLVAFSYAQTKGLGWAAIAIGASLKARRVTGSWDFARAVIEGYRHGKRAAWLSGEDYEQLMHEPIDRVRQRLRIGDPVRYRKTQAMLASIGKTGL